MIIKTLIVGTLETNCYIVGDEVTKEVFIIDPGGDHKKIKNIVANELLIPKAIINTHGHGDHIIANGDFSLPVWIHRLDADFLQDPSKNMAGVFGYFFKTKIADRLLEDSEVLNIGRYRLEVLHTPGHTPGSISLKGDGVIWTGDTLFCGGIGRTDFEYGSEKAIIDSIKKRLMVFPDSYVIYPGHGPSSTIGDERRNNTFV